MTLATKAARGAGAPPGQAAEFGRAAMVHLTAGRRVTEVRAALDTLPSGPIIDHALAMARLAEDAMADDAPAQVICDMQDDLMRSYLEAQPLFTITDAGAKQVAVTLNLAAPQAGGALPPRLTLPDDLAKEMQRLAAKTLVPESEASRLSGAGAGLTDND